MNDRDHTGKGVRIGGGVGARVWLETWFGSICNFRSHPVFGGLGRPISLMIAVERLPDDVVTSLHYEAENPNVSLATMVAVASGMMLWPMVPAPTVADLEGEFSLAEHLLPDLGPDGLGALAGIDSFLGVRLRMVERPPVGDRSAGVGIDLTVRRRDDPEWPGVVVVAGDQAVSVPGPAEVRFKFTSSSGAAVCEFTSAGGALLPVRGLLMPVVHAADDEVADAAQRLRDAGGTIVGAEADDPGTDEPVEDVMGDQFRAWVRNAGGVQGLDGKQLAAGAGLEDDDDDGDEDDDGEG